MNRVAGGDNEYTVANGETVRFDFTPSDAGNVDIRVQVDGGAFQPVANNSYSFVGNGTNRTLVFEFTFAVPGECFIDAPAAAAATPILTKLSTFSIARIREIFFSPLARHAPRP